MESSSGSDPATGRPVDPLGSERVESLTGEELERELTVAAAAPDHLRMTRYQQLLAEKERRQSSTAGRVPPTTAHHAEKALEALHEEFDGVHDRDTIGRLMADSLDRFANAPLEDFVPMLAYRLTRERLKAIARAAGKIPRDRPEVLFVGLEGRGRSQMAAALAEPRSEGNVYAHPVGTQIRVELDDNVVAAMADVGIDLHQAYPVPLTEDVLAGADIVVTLGRSVGSVEIPQGVDHRDWRVGDPVGADLAEVRRIRDELDGRVRELLSDMLLPPEPESSD